MTRTQSLSLHHPPTTSAQWLLIQRIETDLFKGLECLFHKGGGETCFWIGVNDIAHIVVVDPSPTVVDEYKQYPSGLMIKVKLRVDEHTLRQHLLNFAGQMAVEIAKTLRI